MILKEFLEEKQKLKDLPQSEIDEGLVSFVKKKIQQHQEKKQYNNTINKLRAIKKRTCQAGRVGL